MCDTQLQNDSVCARSTAYALLRLPVEWSQAGKSITGILKPLEILTRPQLPRYKPSAGATTAAAAAATAHQAAAASMQGAGSTAGAGEAAAGGSGSQTVQHITAPAEVCSVHQLSQRPCCLDSLQSSLRTAVACACTSKHLSCAQQPNTFGTLPAQQAGYLIIDRI